MNDNWLDYVLRLGGIGFHKSDEEPCHPGGATMVGIKLKGAKNNQYGSNQVRFQHATCDKVLSPVLAARWNKKAAKYFGTVLDEPALEVGSMLHQSSKS